MHRKAIQILLARNGDAVKGDIGKEGCAVCDALLGDAADILKHIREISAYHYLTYRIGYFSVFYKEGVFRNTRKIAVRAGLSARKASEKDTLVYGGYQLAQRGVTFGNDKCA